MAFTPIVQDVNAGIENVSPLNKKNTFTSNVDGVVAWCTCDQSKTFPLCDGSHLKLGSKSE